MLEKSERRFVTRAGAFLLVTLFFLVFLFVAFPWLFRRPHLAWKAQMFLIFSGFCRCPHYQKKPDVRNFSARNSGAGSGWEIGVLWKVLPRVLSVVQGVLPRVLFPLTPYRESILRNTFQSTSRDFTFGAPVAGRPDSGNCSCNLPRRAFYGARIELFFL